MKKSYLHQSCLSKVVAFLTASVDNRVTIFTPPPVYDLPLKADNAAMATPVLVRAYPGDRSSLLSPPVPPGKSAHALPPISAYTFAAILRSSDGPEFQQAIDGIAEICAKNRMSLADEYSSHLPPLGEITAADSAAVRPHMLRPGMRRALTSVPEASSGSSEGSRKSKKRPGGFFGFRRKEELQSKPIRQMRISSIGKLIPVSGTTAVAGSFGPVDDLPSRQASGSNDNQARTRPTASGRRSEAVTSLQQLLGGARTSQPSSGS